MASPQWIVAQAAELRKQLGLQTAGGRSSADDGLSVYVNLIEQVNDARNSFTQDARSALTILFVSFSAGGALLLAWLSGEAPRPSTLTLVLGGCALVAFMLPLYLRGLWMRQVRTSYQIYVAAGIHAAVVAEALGIPPIHPWCIDAVETEAVRGQLYWRRNAWWRSVWKLVTDSSSIHHAAVGVDGEYRFMRGDESRIAPLDSVERITAVWESSKSSFYSTYYSIIMRYVPAIGFLLALGTMALMIVALDDPTGIWSK